MRICNTAILNEQYRILEGMDIQITEGLISKIEKHRQAPSDTKSIAGRQINDEQINGAGMLFMPGLIDSHMHTGQQLLRGRVLDELPMIWTRIMLPFESTLTEEKMELSAKISALEMIKSGTTGFVDAGSYYMEQAAEVYLKSGLRGAISYSTMDQKGLPESIRDTVQTAIKHTDNLYENYHGKGNLKVYYSLRSLMSCSEELILQAAASAKEHGTMLQAHMNEYAGEIHSCMEHQKMRPYEYLDSLGILDEHFLGAHSLLLSENEIEILKNRNVNICHCPFSNCGKAVPNTPELLKKGLIPGLGTDGTAHGGMSLWNEMKIFRSVMNIFHGVPLADPKIMPADRILSMVLEGGAKALGEFGSLGILKEGFRADLIGINLLQPHLTPTGNLVNTLVESVNANDITHMIIDGKLIMKDREVLTLDEEKILREAQQYQQREGR